MPISDVQRTHLARLNAIEIDERGREKLVGLTFEDSEWYLAYLSDQMQGNARSHEDAVRYLELHAQRGRS